MAAANNMVIPPKPVQDTLLLLNSGGDSENIPGIFIDKNIGNDTSKNGPDLPWMDCPVIDLSLLLSSSPAGVEEISKLHSALVSWGSFQVINHGMESKLMDEVRQVIKEFFKQPLEERMKYLRGTYDPEGYGNDTVLSDNVPHNWNDRLYIRVYPHHQRRLNFWPQIPPSFRGLMEEFTAKVRGIHEAIAKAMARSLKLEEESFLEQYGQETIYARINYYPQCPFPELVRASRAHSDASSLTILLQDEQVQGLQVLKDDQWFRVPIIPDALFVNVGDQMEILSNGIFKGAVHRVAANSEKERISLAMFCAPDKDREVEPLRQLVTKERPRLYKKVKSYGQIFFKHHPKGERPIESIKIDTSNDN
ncbi:hypothetical protein Ancab_006086 [Ancistrocladus abbreviatus]